MKLLPSLAVVLSLTVSPQVSPVDRLYVFGDSYSDSGAGYVDGDGPTAVVYLARRLGFELRPAPLAASPSDSLNFAVSGAQTGRGAGRRIKNAFLSLGMAEQVGDFVDRVQSGRVAFDPRTTLFFLAGGLNDRSLPPGATAANLAAHIQALYGVGARRIRVALLPTAIPQFSAVALRLNPEISRVPDEMRARLAALDIGLSQWGPFFDAVFRNPAAYGITNITDACAGRAIFDEDAAPCATPAAHFFYHAGHPSTAVHRIVGDKLYDELRRQ